MEEHQIFLLQAIGKPMIPVFTMLMGAVVKVAANYFLIAIPGVELMGAALGTVLCYVVITVLNLIFLKKVVGFSVNIIETYGRVILSSAVMGILCFGVYYLLHAVLGGTLSMFASIPVGGIAYVVLLFVTGGITREDILLLPKGEKLANILPLKK